MPSKGTTLTKKARTNLDFYHSPTQLRFDTWHRLAEYTNRLNEKQLRKADITSIRLKAKNAIKVLNVIENYTAFPSHEDFQLIWQLYDEIGRAHV